MECWKSIGTLLCCGFIHFATSDKDETNPLLANNVKDEYLDSTCNDEFDSYQMCPRNHEVPCHGKSVGISTNSDLIEQGDRLETHLLGENSDGNGDRKNQIERCRNDLKTQLDQLVRPNVKRAKSLPSNTSVLSSILTADISVCDDDFESTAQSGDFIDLPHWKSPLSHHILRHLTTPNNSSIWTANVPLWKQLDNLIMDERPPMKR